MMKRTLITSLAALVILMAVAAPAHADEEAEVSLKTKKTAAIVEGDTAWVALSWTAKEGDATNFRIVAEVRTRGATVSYPENTGDHSSLMDNDTLSNREIDFTALKVSAPYGVKNVKLRVKASWVSDGERESKTYNVTVPVASFKGEDIAQASKDAGSVSVSEPAWLGVEWTGIAPVLDDVSMTVSGPSGAIVTYPAEGPSTSLHYDNVLEDGETDVARFLVDASALEPGTHSLDVIVTYTKAGRSLKAAGTVSFEVTG